MDNHPQLSSIFILLLYPRYILFNLCPDLLLSVLMSVQIIKNRITKRSRIDKLILSILFIICQIDIVEPLTSSSNTQPLLAPLF